MAKKQARAKGQRRVESKGEAEERLLRPLDVLIVEDSEDDALLAARLLQDGGFEPHWRRVENEAGMREALEEGQWQLILADHHLPGFSAMEAFAIYRQWGLDVPFIIVSGILSEDAAVSAMKAGVHDYLSKDRLARLAPAVHRELTEAEIRRERVCTEAELHATYSELEAIHANAPVALLVVDNELRVEKANDLAARLAGRKSWEMTGLLYGDALRCVNAVSQARGCTCSDQCADCPVRMAMADVLGGGSRREGIESLMRVSVDGHTLDRWLLLSFGAIEAGPGRRKALVCAEDITELKQTQFTLQQQRDGLAFQAHLINLSHDAVIVTDADRKILGWNHGAEETYGWAPAQATGGRISLLLKTSSTDSLVEIDRRLHAEGHWEGELTYIRRDGQPVLTDSRQVLLRDAAGNAIGFLEIDRDITLRRSSEDTLRETVRELESTVAEKTVLLKEIHHRVKNNLAVIASLLSLKAGITQSEDVRLALAESQGRLQAMALIHEHLSGGNRLDRIDFSNYARQLMRQLTVASAGEARRISIELALDPIELGIERAVPCGLILNELISNAFNHAFPDGRPGRIQLTFREVEPGMLELAVEDDGIGLPPGSLGNPSTKSLGLRIVNILTRQLDGCLGQRPSAGTHVVIRMPRQQNGNGRNGGCAK